MNEMAKPVKVAGELFWSKWMEEYNTHFNADNKKYEVTIGKLSNQAAQALTALGIHVKSSDVMGTYIVGKSQFLFDPTDTEGLPVSPSKIGNGSKCTAYVGAYAHKLSGKHGLAPSVSRVVVTNLVEYVPEVSTEDESEPAAL